MAAGNWLAIPGARSQEDEAGVFWRSGCPFSPFEVKDDMKAVGYRWDGAMRCWNLETNEGALGDRAIVKSGV
jgi:hypothetical protein